MDFPPKVGPFRFYKRERVYRTDCLYFDPVAFEGGFYEPGKFNDRFAVYKVIADKFVLNDTYTWRYESVDVCSKRKKKILRLIRQLRSDGFIRHPFDGSTITVEARLGLNRLPETLEWLSKRIAEDGWPRSKKNHEIISRLLAESAIIDMLKS